MNNDTNREPLANRQKRVGANNEVLEEEKIQTPHTHKSKQKQRKPPNIINKGPLKTTTNLGSTSFSKQR